MKYLQLLFMIIAIGLGSLAGGQIARANKIIDIYEQCHIQKQCNNREITEGEVQLSLWDGNLKSYVIGMLLFLIFSNIVGNYQNKSNKSLKSDAASGAV